MQEHEVKRLFTIGDREVISIVGAGGKTSLMFYLAKVLGGRVIVGTTTKILIPTQAYRQYVGQAIQWDTKSQVVVAAKGKQAGKLIGLSPYIDETVYDYLLLEADGSRKLPLKGWGPLEPVVDNKTTITVGVIDITTIGMKVSADTIFRLDDLKKITKLEEEITLNNLKDMVEHEKGLFKNSKGRRILYINKVENQETMNAAKVLCGLLDCNRVESVIIGSINNQIFESVRVE